MKRTQKTSFVDYLFLIRKIQRDVFLEMFPFIKKVGPDSASIAIELLIIARLEKISPISRNIPYLCKIWESEFRCLPDDSRISDSGIVLNEKDQEALKAIFQSDLRDYIIKLNKEIDLAKYRLSNYTEPVKNIGSSMYASFLISSYKTKTSFIGKVN